MITHRIKIDKGRPLGPQLATAANILKEGGLVAFPTETVYGLGANALDENAVEKIFIAKDRPSDDPLIVHVVSNDMLKGLISGEMNEKVRELIDSLWPGPLTLIFNKSDLVPRTVTSGLSTVAIRMPIHPVARELIQQAGIPVAAPSANLFEKPSPTLAKHVLDDLDGRIDMIVDGGSTNIGVESTILDMTNPNKSVLLRPGGVSREQIESIIGPVDLHPSVREKKYAGQVESPGMKVKHYAPNAKIILFEGKIKDQPEQIIKIIKDILVKGKKVGLIAFESSFQMQDVMVRNLGMDKPLIARNLFKTFREFDQIGIDVILAESIDEKGIGLAIMNRLRRASEEIIKVQDGEI